MSVEIRPYTESDFEAFDQCMVKLQQYLASIDPLERIRCAPGYSPKYAEDILRKVAKYEGVIFLAFDGQICVGCGAGIIEQQSEIHRLEVIPTLAGRVQELFVDETYRGQGIGKRLMECVEQDLTSKRCDAIFIEVFAPNTHAREFYSQLGYKERVLDLIKLVDK